MKNFLIVLKFELLNFMKNKTFIIATVIICALLFIGLSIPTITNFFSSTPKDDIMADDLEQTREKDKVYGYINQDDVIPNIEELEEAFTAGKLKAFNDKDELENRVRSREIEAGYIIKGPIQYTHVVQNNEIIGAGTFQFEQALVKAHRMRGFEKKGIPYNTVEELIAVNVERDTKILGTDSASNYLYTYILVFGLYFIILLYGQLIATSVASEKSNRAMEVLVTSTDSSNLIFGKVIGGALAGAIQFGIVLLTAMMTYHLNATAWDGRLDFIFKIPSSVLITFSIFGILGYVFYLFIFGALGALVSRTEDVSASSTPITLIFIAVFFIAIMGMQNTEGLLLKVASFIPFSSFMAMFVRVSMGTVSTMEVVISLGILTITTIMIGFLAASIYRLGTLMYGNPIKFKNAIKLLGKK